MSSLIHWTVAVGTALITIGGAGIYCALSDDRIFGRSEKTLYVGEKSEGIVFGGMAVTIAGVGAMAVQEILRAGTAKQTH